MDRDPATIDMTLHDCEQCGTATMPTYYGDGCDAMVAFVFRR
jgi:hypothetical protein